MYRVIKAFTDLKKYHRYSVGEKYPYNNEDVNAKRIAELSSNQNKMGVPLIEKVEEPKKKKTKKAEDQGE
jgi:hypothetical protein